MAKKPTKPIRMPVSARLYEYLTWLSQNTMLGASENDVATYLLTQKAEELRQSGFHDPDPPKTDDSS